MSVDIKDDLTVLEEYLLTLEKQFKEQAAVEGDVVGVMFDRGAMYIIGRVKSRIKKLKIK